MEQNPENYDFGLKDANVKIMNRNTDNVIKSHNCKQCDYACSDPRALRSHLNPSNQNHNFQDFVPLPLRGVFCFELNKIYHWLLFSNDKC